MGLRDSKNIEYKPISDVEGPTSVEEDTSCMEMKDVLENKNHPYSRTTGHKEEQIPGLDFRCSFCNYQYEVCETKLKCAKCFIIKNSNGLRFKIEEEINKRCKEYLSTSSSTSSSSVSRRSSSSSSDWAYATVAIAMRSGRF